MPSSLFTNSVPVFRRHLKILDTLMVIAEEHATKHKIAPPALLTARLFPDMFTLAGQVRFSCNTALRSIARLLGQEPASFEDAGATFADLRKKIAATLAALDTFPPDAFKEDRSVTFPWGKEQLTVSAPEYLARFSVPNFYFHVCAAYDILRHNGVPVGKGDFLGPLTEEL